MHSTNFEEELWGFQTIGHFNNGELDRVIVQNEKGELGVVLLDPEDHIEIFELGGYHFENSAVSPLDVLPEEEQKIIRELYKDFW